MSQLADLCPSISGPDLELLQNIERGMGITADLSRSDLLLLCPAQGNQVTVIAQAQPHSIASLYDAPCLGQTLSGKDVSTILDAMHGRRHVRGQRDLLPAGAPVWQDVFPVFGRDRKLLALFSIETSLIQLERHRQRHPTFRRAVEWLKGMCLRGELACAEGLSPFGEWDGIVLVDVQRRITYLSGIATNLYRRLGYMEDLRGRRLAYLNTKDDELAAAAIENRCPIEREDLEGSHVWVRKVLPVWPPPTFGGWFQGLFSRRAGAGDIGGVLILVHDATEEHRKLQELKIKTTMIQEVHHRVKNNLQAITAMLRMQSRRTTSSEAQHVLLEAVNRIMSVAVIHEYLSLEETQAINMRDVCQRIVNQNRQVIMAPGQEIRLSVEGPAIYLPSQQATACALVINELIHNALEHGFESQKRGEVRVVLTDAGDRVQFEIWDDGSQLPEDFDLSRPSSLGLQIVQTLVRDDLRGQLSIQNKGNGVSASLEFPKVAVTREIRANTPVVAQ